MQQHKRSAFTLLELIFVIVILGIVASIGSEIIAKVYQQYIVQRAQHRASLKTELAALQIANRLAAAIPGTVYRKRRVAGTEDWVEEINNNLGNPTQSDQYNVLQWVGADMDSFSATATPGWSGFCDLDASTTPTISTPGSNLSKTNAIITKLAGGTLPSFNPALFFQYDSTPYTVTTPLSGNTITFTGTIPTHIVEHYKLAWSSYALVVEPEVVDGKTYNSLFLYYNFTPTPATTVGTIKSLLLRNISSFKFKGAGRTIRFKICKEEEIGEDFNITACKEKAVF